MKIAHSHDGARKCNPDVLIHAGVQLGFLWPLLLRSCLESSLKYLYVHEYFAYCCHRDT